MSDANQAPQPTVPVNVLEPGQAQDLINGSKDDAVTKVNESISALRDGTRDMSKPLTQLEVSFLEGVVAGQDQLQIKELQEKLTKAESDLTDLNGQLEKSKADLASANSTDGDKDKEIAQLKEDLQKATTERTQSDQAVEGLKKQIESLGVPSNEFSDVAVRDYVLNRANELRIKFTTNPTQPGYHKAINLIDQLETTALGLDLLKDYETTD